MSRYYFDVHDGISTHDDVGMDLPDLSSAQMQAARIATQYVTKPEMLSETGGAVVVEVYDASRVEVSVLRLVFTIGVRERADQTLN